MDSLEEGNFLNVDGAYNKLEISAKQFEPVRVFGKPVFVNTVPKSGTHLLGNIFVHFLGTEYEYSPIVVESLLREALDDLNAGEHKLYLGHLLYNMETRNFAEKTNMLLAKRFVNDYICSMANWWQHKAFLPADEMSRFLVVHSISPEQSRACAIVGESLSLYRYPDLCEMYIKNYFQWCPLAKCVVNFEELLSSIKNINTNEAEVYFSGILDALEVEKPADWRERVLAGANPAGSVTYFMGQKKGMSLAQERLLRLQCRNIDEVSRI